MRQNALEAPHVVRHGINQVSRTVLVEIAKTQFTEMISQLNSELSCYIEGSFKTKEIAFPVNDDPINHPQQADQCVNANFVHGKCAEKEIQHR